MENKVYDRKNQQLYIEKQFKNKQLRFLYNTIVGRILLKIVTKKHFSKLLTLSDDKEKSVKKIAPFIKAYNIDMSEYPNIQYASFNEFFTRKILLDKRPITKLASELIAVADSKLSLYQINDNLTLSIKNSMYNLEQLLQNKSLAANYKNGLCLVFRLTVDDYHRYCFIDKGIVKESQIIKGLLHTVSPISLKRYNVYVENHREYTVLNTASFGEVIQIEIGALSVGKIHNHDINEFNKGDEKGYFSLGGSTIVLLLKSNTVIIDQDILQYTNQGIEVKVTMGEKIGERIRCLKD